MTKSNSVNQPHEDWADMSDTEIVPASGSATPSGLSGPVPAKLEQKETMTCTTFGDAVGKTNHDSIKANPAKSDAKIRAQALLGELTYLLAELSYKDRKIFIASLAGNLEGYQLVPISREIGSRQTKSDGKAAQSSKKTEKASEEKGPGSRDTSKDPKIVKDVRVRIKSLTKSLQERKKELGLTKDQTSEELIPVSNEIKRGSELIRNFAKVTDLGEALKHLRVYDPSKTVDSPAKQEAEEALKLFLSGRQ